MGEVAVLGAAQFVRRAILVNEPGDLVGVPRKVGRKLRPDHEIDRASVALAEIEQPPGCGMRKDLLLRIPLERQLTSSVEYPRSRNSRNELTNMHSAPPCTKHLRLATSTSVRPWDCGSTTM